MRVQVEGLTGVGRVHEKLMEEYIASRLSTTLTDSLQGDESKKQSVEDTLFKISPELKVSAQHANGMMCCDNT